MSGRGTIGRDMSRRGGRETMGIRDEGRAADEGQGDERWADERRADERRGGRETMRTRDELMRDEEGMRRRGLAV